MLGSRLALRLSIALTIPQKANRKRSLCNCLVASTIRATLVSFKAALEDKRAGLGVTVFVSLVLDRTREGAFAKAYNADYRIRWRDVRSGHSGCNHHVPGRGRVVQRTCLARSEWLYGRGPGGAPISSE